MEKMGRPKLKVKRQQVRRRRHQSAWITLEDGTANCKCQVADISQGGAKITLDLGAERGDVAANISVIRDLPDRQANPAVPLSSEQDDDNSGSDQNGEPDKRDPRPRPSSRPRHIRRRSLRRHGQHRRSFVIGG